MMHKGRIVAFVPDLFFSTRVSDVLRHLGYEPQIVERGEQLASALEPQAEQEPVLVIIDINAPPTAWHAAVQRLKADPIRRRIPVLAFGSHLDVERQRVAREAGCDRVVANSRLHEALPTLVESLLGAQE